MDTLIYPGAVLVVMLFAIWRGHSVTIFRFEPKGRKRNQPRANVGQSALKTR